MFSLHQLPSHHIIIKYLCTCTIITIINSKFDLPFDSVHQDNLLNHICFLYAQQEKIHFASPKNTAEIKMKHWFNLGSKETEKQSLDYVFKSILNTTDFIYYLN